MKRSYGITALIIALVIAGACWAASSKLIINGELASTDVRVIGGKSYAPLSDIAKSLGMVVTKSGSTYTMAIPGGADQLQGKAQGKIGQEIFSGKWRFQVLSVERSGEWKEKYYQAGRTIKPDKGDELIIVNCRLKNGLKNKSQTPTLTERMCGNTALADDNGNSYPPKDFDARQESDKIQSYASISLLPGAKIDFAILFSVPKGTTPKSLVFSEAAYPDDLPYKFTDVRVDLTE